VVWLEVRVSAAAYLHGEPQPGTHGQELAVGRHHTLRVAWETTHNYHTGQHASHMYGPTWGFMGL